MTPTHIESAIGFDFTAATLIEKHDHINRVFKAVDFIIEDGNAEIWLEVKNWDPSRIPANHRRNQRRMFLRRIRGERFCQDELLGKFVGTSAFRFHNGQTRLGALKYVVVLNEPRLDRATLLRLNDKLINLIQPASHVLPVIVAVVDRVTWNREFPHLPCIT